LDNDRTVKTLEDHHITVAGLGRFGGGIAVTRWLVEQGALVLVTDVDPAEKLADSVQQLDGLPVTFRLGEHRTEDFSSADLVVASPAIPMSNRYLAAARDAGVPVTTEIRLFIERCPARRIVGVTGTKGKSTTTALLGAMLRTAHTTWVGGNIGGSLLFDLPKIAPNDVVVLELSSYMLEHLRAARWSPHVAVATMLAIDHTQWHGSVDAYHDAKANLFRFQTASDFAVLPADGHADKLIDGAASKVVRFSVAGEHIDLALPGDHNQLNAQAAAVAAQLLDVRFDDIQRVARSFVGLPHRLELVTERNGVRYYNDSIATIPEATVAALQAFPDRSVWLIVGGYDKGLDLSPMITAAAARARQALCVGSLGPTLAARIGGGAIDCGDLPTAVGHAARGAAPGDIVLLSPGCASFDQFVNFEARGDTFRKIVNELG